MRTRILCLVIIGLASTSILTAVYGAHFRPTHPGFPLSLDESLDYAVDLPPGWTEQQLEGELGDFRWENVPFSPYSPPKSAFLTAFYHVTDNVLVTPSVTLPGPAFTRQMLVFWHSFNFEPDFDGAVVEIRIGAGSFTDIIAAGGVALNGGYTHTLSGKGNPLRGRPAFSGNSGRSDYTVWRPSNGMWYTMFSNTGAIAAVEWGINGDRPVGRRPGT